MLEVFTLLTWAAAALQERRAHPAPAHLDAIERIAPTLRALRHADGGLARFHGGGRGLEGRLDQALAASAVRGPLPQGLAMGFARLHAGRSTVIVDAAPPPQGAASGNGHASTLGFELTSGRRPLVVNCGSGAIFGRDWHRAGRATASHSTLEIEGFSSARLGPERVIGRGARTWFDEVPSEVWARVEGDPRAISCLATTAMRRPWHDPSARAGAEPRPGRLLRGQDSLGAMTPEDRRRFETIFNAEGLRGIRLRSASTCTPRPTPGWTWAGPRFRSR